MVVCFSCWQVIARKLLVDFDERIPCPVKGCYGILIEIDENLIAVIQTLNGKNFYTTNCCSGHIWGNGTPERTSAYIAFHKDIQRKELKRLPEGWKIDKDQSNGDIIRAVFANDDPIGLHLSILKGMEDIARWADSLEPREESFDLTPHD